MHRFIPETDAPAPSPIPNSEHVDALRRWTREILRLPPDTPVTVSDSPCLDPGCPLVETTITLFEPHQTRAWRFTRPAPAVTKLMLSQTLATRPHTESRRKH